ncbi:MAG: ATP-binding protein [Ferruginibacter sp.]
MKFFKSTIFFLLLVELCYAQDTTIALNKGMIDKPTDAIYFGWFDGWLFKQGNGKGFEKINIDTTGWKKLRPVELSKQYADKKGRIEGWFRVKIQLDSSLLNLQTGFDFSFYAATEFFIDGKKIAAKGNMGDNGKPFSEYNGGLDPVIVNLPSSSPHLLAIHFVTYLSPINELKIRGGNIIFLTGPNYSNFRAELTKNYISVFYFLLSACALLSILFWMLFLQNKQETNLVWIAIFTSALTLCVYFLIAAFDTGVPYTKLFIFYELQNLLVLVTSVILLPLLLIKVFNRKISKALLWILILLVLLNYIGSLIPQWNIESAGNIARIITIFLVLGICIYYLITSWKNLKGAQWAIVFGLIFFITAFIIQNIIQAAFTNLASSAIFKVVSISLVVLSIPFSLLVYVSMRFKEIIREVQVNANKVIELSEEKKIQAENQQKILQEEVKKQTAEISNALDNLKSTQSQLIQSEKMASLGELTAGIAHEIQNPLNFVNNFSEVNTELIEELVDEVGKGNTGEAISIAKDIKENEQKINHHGKRADAIVKGMLQHSRSSNGIKEPTDINALCDEYLRLSYHGLRAKDKSFNATIKTDFDNSIGKINIIPQDIGRVILNLLTNAFYVVNEKKKQTSDNYEPTVTVKTSQTPPSGGRGVHIKVTDNGNGIPQNIIPKIFQPFFTTKPTGQGTGLGLSLSYDIITKGHAGELKVETVAGDGSTFIIELPQSEMRN